MQIRVRPFFKFFRAQLSAGRSHRAVNEDIKFFEIGQCLTLPLGHCLFKLHVEPARFGVT